MEVIYLPTLGQTMAERLHFPGYASTRRTPLRLLLKQLKNKAIDPSH